MIAKIISLSLYASCFLPSANAMEPHLVQNIGERSLAAQIADVMPYLSTVAHPRLILGVGNTLDASANQGGNVFLENPNDVLCDMTQKEGVLPERSLAFDFNNLEHLNQLAAAFPNTFSTITADFLVVKYSAWTNDHLTAFEKMLKPGGELFITIDTNFPALLAEKADTQEEAFRLGMQRIIAQTEQLLLSSGVPSFAALPKELASTVIVNPDDIQREFDLYKNNWFQGHWSQDLKIKRREFNAFRRSQGGVTSDIFGLSDELVNNEAVLKRQLSMFLTKRASQPLILEMSKTFFEEYLIPDHYMPIISQVFPVANITIAKNLALPQPHRCSIFEGYSLSAKKHH